jgi:hypothetical protein
VTVEEERDNVVPGRDGEGRADGGDGVDLVAATEWRRTGWRWRRRRGRGNIWQPNGVQVKILWLGFKDQEIGVL